MQENDRRLLADSLGVSPDVAVQHDVAQDQHARLLQALHQVNQLRRHPRLLGQESGVRRQESLHVLSGASTLTSPLDSWFLTPGTKRLDPQWRLVTSRPPISGPRRHAKWGAESHDAQ